MNKRIRKKKCLGEFKELAFDLTATYAKLEPEAADELVDKILAKAGELNMTCGGTFNLDNCDLLFATGRIRTNEAERKDKMVEFFRSIPGVEKVEASDFFDACYTPIEDDECGCGVLQGAQRGTVPLRDLPGNRRTRHRRRARRNGRTPRHDDQPRRSSED